ncbi:undecaprenyl/decaprenyl-phosphate alpha-N-acetylglucosaminyl 1-phosphate transferase [Candidatus Saganbacteria bacterium]|nr:undecaprenyl/decaprenyl-phosphate alpha-N-acetylglucosaminyl 1-phosphate transferase [Candidatus Saganbacteria bacterium]
MILYLTTFFIAFFATILLTPMVIDFASKKGFVDRPNERKIHTSPVPRLGGIAIYIGFLLSIVAALVLLEHFEIQINIQPIFGLLISSTIIFLMGLFDDIYNLRSSAKFIWQVIAASLMVLFGVEINFISNPFNGIILFSAFISIPLTLLWITGVTNAINLIDGLDGLAAGVTAISAGTLFIVALRTHEIGAALILLSLAGVCLGFLKFNFFPARIFLGDSGSYLLGFIIASAAIIGVFKTTLVVALIIPLLILGVPIFDMMFAIGRRLSSGANPFKADNKHIHHMLLRAGFTQREAVLSIYVACFLLSIFAILMALQR